MKIISKIMRILLCTIIVFLLIIAGVFIFEPLSRPKKSVYNYVLRKIPLETSWSETINIAEKNNWVMTEINKERGLRINDKAENVSIASKEDLNDIDNKNIRISGKMAMKIELGEYHLPFDTAVFAYLAFDENEKLVEVVVKKDIDAL